MDVTLINPFLDATIKVIETMAMTKVSVGKPAVKQGKGTWGTVTGIIGIASKGLSGNLVLSFEEPCILAIVNNMIGEKHQTINEEIVDAVGELTNMISGGAKAALSEQGLLCDMATPMTVVGRDIEIKQFSSAPVISIPFETEAGKFVVEVCLKRDAKKA
jgi:chemotaxis protein CheX